MIVAIDIDAQNTFTPLCPEELPVSGGTEIVAELNAQAALAALRVMSKDAHCREALWRCETPAEMLKPTGLKNADVTWVAHGIVGSYGFRLIEGLPAPTDYDFCVWKGMEPDLHPYGICYHDLEGRLSTGLLEWLQVKGARTLLVGGLATDYCVKTSVLQLLNARLGFRVIVNQAACRGIGLETTAAAWREMAAAGALLAANTAAIKTLLKNLGPG